MLYPNFSNLSRNFLNVSAGAAQSGASLQLLPGVCPGTTGAYVIAGPATPTAAVDGPAAVPAEAAAACCIIKACNATISPICLSSKITYLFYLYFNKNFSPLDLKPHNSTN